jgi:hypothetical protein
MPELVLSHRKNLFTEVLPGNYVWIDPEILFSEDLWEEEVLPLIEQNLVGEIYFDLGSSELLKAMSNGQNSSVCRLFNLEGDGKYQYRLYLEGNIEIGQIVSDSGYLCLVDSSMFGMLNQSELLNDLLSNSEAFYIEVPQLTDLRYTVNHSVIFGDHHVLFNKVKAAKKKQIRQRDIIPDIIDIDIDEENVVPESSGDRLNLEDLLSDDEIPRKKSSFVLKPFQDVQIRRVSNEQDNVAERWFEPTYAIDGAERDCKVMIGSHRNVDISPLDNLQSIQEAIGDLDPPAGFNPQGFNLFSFLQNLINNRINKNDSDSEINGEYLPIEDVP